MNVVDVGAHVGVYSLLAAQLVGKNGVVHAIDPQKECISMITNNAAINDFSNIQTHCIALAAADGEQRLNVDTRRMAAVVAPTPPGIAEEWVYTRTLTTFAATVSLNQIDLLKVDAAGDEYSVLVGGTPLLSTRRVSNIILKLYSPDVVADRFGAERDPYASLDLLTALGYQISLSTGQPTDVASIKAATRNIGYSVPILAKLLEPIEREL